MAQDRLEGDRTFETSEKGDEIRGKASPHSGIAEGQVPFEGSGQGISRGVSGFPSRRYSGDPGSIQD